MYIDFIHGFASNDSLHIGYGKFVYGHVKQSRFDILAIF